MKIKVIIKEDSDVVRNLIMALIKLLEEVDNEVND